MRRLTLLLCAVLPTASVRAAEPLPAKDECACAPAELTAAESRAVYAKLETEGEVAASGPVRAVADVELARASFRAKPQVGYLPSAIVIADVKGVPLHAGAPVVTWRDANGPKQCAIGWRNGLFGGAMGEGHLRWLCFQDRDGDGAFDLAWYPQSKSLGLSYQRRDIPLETPVRLTSQPLSDASAKIDRRATVPELNWNQRLIVGKVDDRFVYIDHMIGQRGLWLRAARKKVPLGGDSDIEIAGARVRIRSAQSGTTAELLGSNPFVPTLACDATRVKTGGDSMAIAYTFGSW